MAYDRAKRFLSGMSLGAIVGAIACAAVTVIAPPVGFTMFVMWGAAVAGGGALGALGGEVYHRRAVQSQEEETYDSVQYDRDEPSVNEHNRIDEEDNDRLQTEGDQESIIPSVITPSVWGVDVEEDSEELETKDSDTGIAAQRRSSNSQNTAKQVQPASSTKPAFPKPEIKGTPGLDLSTRSVSMPQSKRQQEKGSLLRAYRSLTSPWSLFGNRREKEAVNLGGSSLSVGNKSKITNGVIDQNFSSMVARQSPGPH